MMMRFNKTSLAVAVALALGSTSALAVVNLDAGTGGPLYFASEIIASTTTPANVATNAVGVATTVQMALGEPLALPANQAFVRVDLGNGAKFAAAPTLGIATAAAPGVPVACAATSLVPPLCTLAGGGTGASFAIFEVDGTVAKNATDLLTLTTVAPGIGITGTTGPVSVRFSTWGSIGNATNQVGIPNKDKSSSYLAFSDSYSLSVSLPTPVSIADVAATAPFTKFPGGAVTTRLGNYTLGLVLANAAGTAPTYDIAGGFTGLGTLLGTKSKLVVSGNFAARATANAVRDIFPGGCGGPGGTTLNPITDSQADYTLDPIPFPGTRDICYTVNGTTPMPASDYTIGLTAVSAASAVYAVKSLGPLALGNIVRNGTELQAPLAQTPTGWTSRISFTNTGTLDRAYTIRVLSEGSNTATLGTASTGTIPAGKILVVDVTDIVTITPSDPASPARRAAIVATVTGPNNEIQAVYQLVSPSSAVTNMAMIRPATN